jgi:GcrA cell cycle regulator
MGWTDERVELLKSLWKDGWSAAQIARQLGGVTRNGVLGKIHRLGLSERAVASKPAKAPRPAPLPKPSAPRAVTLRLAGNSTVLHEEPEAARPPREIVPFRAEAPGTATALTLGPYQCKWPIGDPQEPTFTHCGRKAPDGPYCAEHAAVAYQAPTKRKPSANELARALRRYL